MQTQPEKNFDFITKISERTPNDTFTQSVVKYILHFCDAKKMLIAALVATGCFTVASIPYYIYKSVHESSLQTAKVEDARLTESMNNVKKLTPEDIDKTVAYIRKMQALRTKQLTDLYWKIKFVETKDPKKYPLASFMRDIAKLNLNMRTHYNNRINETTLTYNSLKAGNKNVRSQTYDNENIFDSIIFWKNAAEVNTVTPYEPIDNYLFKWDEDFLDQAGLQKYLADNKTVIENAQVFGQ